MAPAEIAPILHTPRLTLVRFSWSRPEDAVCIIDSFNDPVAIKNQGDFNIKTPDDVRNWERGTQLSTATLKDAYQRSGRPVPSDGISPPTLPWYIVRLGANNPEGPRIGIVTIMEAQPPVPHIGWAFLSQHHNNGYATEAAREILRYFQEDFGIEVVMALTDPHNRGSWHVAEKLGMVQNPHRLSWMGGEDRKAPEEAPEGTGLKCYLTPNAKPLPEGTAFGLFHKD